MNKFVINSENLLNNVSVIRSKIGTKTKICAMVKADAYGHDAKVVAKLLKNVVNYFGVANIQEAIELRNCGIRNNILVVGKVEDKDLELTSKYDIEFAVFDYDQILAMSKLSAYTFKIHIKVNTGMNRLGVDTLSEYKNMLDKISKCSNISQVGLFTHFGSVDSDKKYTDKQFNKFQKYIQITDKKVIKHCANSSAIFSDSKYHLDMVRPGICIYGYENDIMKHVLSIRSAVVDLHNVKKGEKVSYDDGYIVKKSQIIATIPLGYADGIPRSFMNKITITARDKVFRGCGKVCMDMCIFGVDDSIKLFDEVLINFDAKEWATILNTISYEILTNISYKRMVVTII